MILSVLLSTTTFGQTVSPNATVDAAGDHIVSFQADGMSNGDAIELTTLETHLDIEHTGEAGDPYNVKARMGYVGDLDIGRLYDESQLSPFDVLSNANAKTYLPDRLALLVVNSAGDAMDDCALNEIIELRASATATLDNSAGDGACSDTDCLMKVTSKRFTNQLSGGSDNLITSYPLRGEAAGQSGFDFTDNGVEFKKCFGSDSINQGDENADESKIDYTLDLYLRLSAFKDDGNCAADATSAVDKNGIDTCMEASLYKAEDFVHVQLTITQDISDSTDTQTAITAVAAQQVTDGAQESALVDTVTLRILSSLAIVDSNADVRKGQIFAMKHCVDTDLPAGALWDHGCANANSVAANAYSSAGFTAAGPLLDGEGAFWALTHSVAPGAQDLCSDADGFADGNAWEVTHGDSNTHCLNAEGQVSANLGTDVCKSQFMRVVSNDNACRALDENEAALGSKAHCWRKFCVYFWHQVSASGTTTSKIGFDATAEA